MPLILVVTAGSAVVSVVCRTVMVAVVDLPPVLVVQVMTAWPTLSAFIVPEAETVATAALLLLHATALFVALAGSIFAVSVSAAAIANVVDVLFNVTPATTACAVTQP
jgi:hypothetical protein